VHAQYRCGCLPLATKRSARRSRPLDFLADFLGRSRLPTLKTACA
jgi:hypothetical protein